MTVAVIRRCVKCGGSLPEGSRSDRRYCGDACRTAAYAERQRQERTRLVIEHEVEHEASAYEHDDRLDRLRDAVREAIQEPRLLGVIAAEARHNWRASAWLLSRIHPDRWGERGRDVPFEVGTDPDDPFREVDELADRRRRRPDGY